MTFWFRAREKRTVTCVTSGPAPQSRGGRASIPGRSGLNPRPPPKVTQVTALSPGLAPKSHKSRPFLPAQAPQKSQVTALSPGPKTQKSRLNSRPRPPKPKSHASIPGEVGPQSQAPQKSRKSRPFLLAQALQKSQVTALSPGPGPPKVTSHGPFSRPRPPKGHKSRPFLPAPKPKSHASIPGSRAPKPKSHASIPPGPQNPKDTPQFKAKYRK